MSDLKAQYKRGFDAFTRGEYDEAIAAYQQVIEADAGFALVYHALAEAHARKGELERALEVIDRAIELEPSESLYHTSRSRLLQQLGRIAEAEDEAALAMRLQSG